MRRAHGPGRLAAAGLDVPKNPAARWDGDDYRVVSNFSFEGEVRTQPPVGGVVAGGAESEL